VADRLTLEVRQQPQLQVPTEWKAKKVLQILLG